VQLVIYLGHLVRGDLGASTNDGQPVVSKLALYFPATLELALSALTFAVLFGVPLGVLAALRRGSPLDSVLMSLSVLGVSVPIFVLGFFMIYAFALVPARLGHDVLPISGRNLLTYFVPARTHLMLVDTLLAGNVPAFFDALRHLVLPAVTLGTIPLAIIAKITRSGMLEVLGSDYVRTARAKGLDPRSVVVGHALRNALLPILTVVGLQTGLLLGGAILTESVYAWPGVGRLAFDAVSNRDMPLVNGCILLFATVFVVVNTIVDVLYAVANPRIRYGAQ
jgi:dipeptide transport system permease protein